MCASVRTDDATASLRSEGRGVAADATIPDRARPRGLARVPAFTVWGVAAYGVTLAGALVLALVVTGGRLVYVIDDPAIHLSIAGNLADHGTWGVEAGRFQSASSAPLWTLLLALWDRLLPGGAAVAPLALSVAACVAIVAVLGATQDVLQPARRRPLDAVATAALVVVVLFLPGLTMVGMEHALQAALVLGAVVAFHRRAGPPWLPYALLVLGALTRFETAFVAVGLAAAMLVTSRHAWRRPAGVMAAGLLPIAAFALLNRLMGQGFLPNSVLAKTAFNAASEPLYREVTQRITEDPLVAVLLAVFVVGLLVVWHWREAAPGWVFPAEVYVVATILHVLLARVGWYERYQAYLLVLGVYALLCMMVDVLPAQRASPRGAAAPERLGLPAAIVLVLLLFTATKADLTINIPEAVDETYQQRYQAGLFFDRYYDGEPIATGELGYVTLFHDGPITDLFGLGDYEVLQARRRFGQQPPAEYWRDLVDRRGFDVVGAYPTTLFFDTPDDWILVGTWAIDGETITAWEPDFQFWATRPEAVNELAANLREFEPELPAGVTLRVNDLAELRAAELEEAAASG